MAREKLTQDECTLVYTYSYTHKDLDRLKVEAQASLFTYEELLQMEIDILKKREARGDGAKKVKK